jgi:hypothetical protein
MHTLAAQQQALLAALFDWPSDIAIEKIAIYAGNTCARGLNAYQSNGHALADRALQAAYPVVAQLLGVESFSALARVLWHDQPPVMGDVAQWGSGLADFVRHSDQLQSTPYLGDVAALEWAVHRAANAADAALDAPSFALLAQHDPGDVRLRLAAGCCVLACDWPVVSIWHAHIDQSLSFDTVRQRLQARTPECALVWRVGWRVQVRTCSPQECALLRALLANHSLGQALDAQASLSDVAVEVPPWDISHWLAQAVQSGLLLGVTPATPAEPRVT